MYFKFFVCLGFNLCFRVMLDCLFFGMVSAFSMLPTCISLSFTPKLDLLPSGHTKVVLDDKTLWPFPTWLYVKLCCNLDNLRAYCTSMTFPSSNLLVFKLSQEDFSSVCVILLLCTTFSFIKFAHASVFWKLSLSLTIIWIYPAVYRSI